MDDAVIFGWKNFVKLFFLFTPFFILNYFLGVTAGAEPAAVRRVARRVTWTVLVIGTLLYFAGEWLLALFGLELEGFRIGAGILLMFTGVPLAVGNDVKPVASADDIENIVVVPMAIPTIFGPSCVSAVVIIGADTMRRTLSGAVTPVYLLVGFAGLALAILALGLIMYFSGGLERLFGQKTIRIFSKLSGVVLTVIAAQMIVHGFVAYLDSSAVGAALLRSVTGG